MGRGLHGILKLIAILEAALEHRPRKNCDHPVSKLHRQLPTNEFLVIPCAHAWDPGKPCAHRTWRT